MLVILLKKINEINVVINGAGASAMACAKLFINSGVDKNKIKMLDLKRSYLQRQR